MSHIPGKIKVRIFCEISIILLSYLFILIIYPALTDIADLYRESLKASEKYEVCLTTTIYGNTYLDSEKCKARGFDLTK